jgi:uncharacterized protein (TIGR00369 family)
MTTGHDGSREAGMIAEDADDVPPGFDRYFHPGPFGNLVGPFYHKEIDDGGFIRAFRVLEKHTNQVDIVQGGMLCAFTDMLITTALIRAGLGGVTVNLNVNFMNAARLGDWVEGRATVRKDGSRIVWGEGELRVGDRIVLTATGLWQKRDFKQPLRTAD